DVIFYWDGTQNEQINRRLVVDATIEGAYFESAAGWPMKPTDLEFTPEETGRLGDEIYRRVVLPQLKAEDKGKAVAIDVKSEAWAMSETGGAAARELRVGHPDAEVWIVRVGSRVYHHFGGRARPSRS